MVNGKKYGFSTATMSGVLMLWGEDGLVWFGESAWGTVLVDVREGEGET